MSAQLDVYKPGIIRSHADRQAVAVEAFLAKYPEYARLAPAVLEQYAATYRDDRDHALEQEYRGNGVLAGCRADYEHRERRERGGLVTSDEVSLGAQEGLQ